MPLHFKPVSAKFAGTVQKWRKMLKFSYSAVEQALAKTYGASDDEVRQTAFRARINSLQRLGVLGDKVKVGKGARLTYSVEQMERWLACLELSELGISPTVAGKLVIAYWAKKFAPIFRAAQKTVEHDPSLEDVIMYLGGVQLMSGSWSPGPDFPGVPNVNSCPLRKLPNHMEGWMRMGGRDRLPARALVVNLSSLLRQFHAALAMPEMPEMGKKRRKP
jgi:hypothetical protein